MPGGCAGICTPSLNGTVSAASAGIAMVAVRSATAQEPLQECNLVMGTSLPAGMPKQTLRPKTARCPCVQAIDNTGLVTRISYRLEAVTGVISAVLLPPLSLWARVTI